MINMNPSGHSNSINSVRSDLSNNSGYSDSTLSCATSYIVNTDDFLQSSQVSEREKRYLSTSFSFAELNSLKPEDAQRIILHMLTNTNIGSEQMIPQLLKYACDKNFDFRKVLPPTLEDAYKNQCIKIFLEIVDRLHTLTAQLRTHQSGKDKGVVLETTIADKENEIKTIMRVVDGFYGSHNDQTRIGSSFFISYEMHQFILNASEGKNDPLQMPEFEHMMAAQFRKSRPERTSQPSEYPFDRTTLTESIAITSTNIKQSQKAIYSEAVKRNHEVVNKWVNDANNDLAILRKDLLSLAQSENTDQENKFQQGVNIQLKIAKQEEDLNAAKRLQVFYEDLYERSQIHN